MNIYFSGSIYGGRQKLDTYKKLVKELSKFGKVLDEEVADDNVLIKEENITDNDVFETLVKKNKYCRCNICRSNCTITRCRV